MRSQILRILAGAMLLGASGATGGEILRNNDVALMIEAGLSEEIIKEKIASTDNWFEMSAAAMIELQNRSVPESLIQLMHREALKTAKKFHARLLSELRKFATGDPENRRAAFLYVKKNRDSATPQIRDALTSPQAEIRRAAVEILSEFNDQISAPLFRDLLIDVDPATRHAAADGLVRLGDQEMVATAQKALRQDAASPRSGYVRLLGGVKDIASADLIGRRLLKDPDAITRVEAAVALGEINAGSAAKTLEEALRYDAALEVRAAAITALGKIAAPENFTLLAEICRTNPALRGAGLGAIAHYPAQESVPFLIEALAQPLRPDEKSTVTVALRELTDRDFGDTYAAWEQFLILFKAEHAFAQYSEKTAPENLLSAINLSAATPAVESIIELENLTDLE